MTLAHPEASFCPAFRRPLALVLLSCAALPLAGCPLQTASIGRRNEDASHVETPDPSDQEIGSEPPNVGGGPPEEDDGGGGGGSAGADAFIDDGDGGSASAKPPPRDASLCTASFPMTVRDFSEKHQDFGPSQTTGGKKFEPETELQNGKPVVANPPEEGASAGDSFDEWFQDDPAVNRTLHQLIHLDVRNGRGQLGDRSFYYVDGRGFGNEGYAHNFGFTVEFEVPFTYAQGSSFAYESSDDVWISVDDTIVAEHSVSDGVNGGIVRLDAWADALHLKPGSSHKLKVFYAERNFEASVFLLETALNIECVEAID
ncbi:fibro-slime domain-containing protein [Sorangium cellulosum]|uniref:fibro-slime domain-containing protein n=1 Tax=Sorangium cellulosum TaxID=56 RepID=UPI0009B8FD0F|nr:fibro-slime domain-containing protein [Sorangium cellulosum]